MCQDRSRPFSYLPCPYPGDVISPIGDYQYYINFTKVLENHLILPLEQSRFPKPELQLQTPAVTLHIPWSLQWESIEQWKTVKEQKELTFIYVFSS